MVSLRWPIGFSRLPDKPHFLFERIKPSLAARLKPSQNFFLCFTEYQILVLLIEIHINQDPFSRYFLTVLFYC